MATRTVVTLVDDVDGGVAEESLSFGLDGVEYEIDLSRTNAAALRDVLAEFVAHAHRTPVRPRRSRSRESSGSGSGRAAKVRPRVGTDESMTAEIRRLASEAHQAVQSDEPAEPVADTATPTASRRSGSEPDREPVRRLIVPFQEAGL